MSHGRSKRRFTARPLDIDVYPLLVVCQAGKRVNHILRNRLPRADSDFLADSRPYFVNGHYLPSTEKASRTFPGWPMIRPYPEWTYSIPSATVGPPVSSEPPLPFTPFTGSKATPVS